MKIKIIISLSILAMACCLVAACNTAPQRLPTPTNLRMEGTVLVWDEVENAAGYRVKYLKEEHEVDECRYDLTSLTTAYTYEIQVQALGDGETYVSSMYGKYSYTVKEPEEEEIIPTANLKYTLLEDVSGYEVSQGTADLTGTIIIPDYYKGLPVKRIADRGFNYEGLFHDAETGEGYNTVTTAVRLPAYLEEIGKHAFGYMWALTRIEIPQSVTKIGASAFILNIHLEEVVLPEGLKYIGERAFASCYSLLNINIPSSVKYIGYKILVNTAWYEAQPDGMVTINGDILYGYKGETPSGVIDSLPSYIKYIAGGAFSYSNITSIIIPDGVKLIGNSVFWENESLEEVYLPPNSLTVIYESMFFLCSSLTTVNIPDGVTVIERFAFAHCPLENLNIPEGVTEIGEGAFSGVNVKTVKLPSTLKVIGRHAFYNCQSLERIRIPDGVEELGDEVFGMDINLKELIINKSLSAYLKNSISYYGGVMDIEKIYYIGTQADWDEEVTESAALSESTKVYFYIEDESDVPADGGNYWHFDEDGKTPVLWTQDVTVE